MRQSHVPWKARRKRCMRRSKNDCICPMTAPKVKRWAPEGALIGTRCPDLLTLPTILRYKLQSFHREKLSTFPSLCCLLVLLIKLQLSNLPLPFQEMQMCWPGKGSPMTMMRLSQETMPMDAQFLCIPRQSEDDYLDLRFDPDLNCYFDPETGKYYELLWG